MKVGLPGPALFFARQHWLRVYPREWSIGFYVPWRLFYNAGLIWLKIFQIRSDLWGYKNLPSSPMNCICWGAGPTRTHSKAVKSQYIVKCPRPNLKVTYFPHLFPCVCSSVSCNGTWTLLCGQDFLKLARPCRAHPHSRCGLPELRVWRWGFWSWLLDCLARWLEQPLIESSL